MTTWEAKSERLNLNLNLDRLDISVLAVLSSFFLGAVTASWFFHAAASTIRADWWDSVLQNTGTEMFGAVLTFYLIEVMLRKRREQDVERRAIEQEKERLVLQMGSPDNALALEAVRVLKARGRWGFGEDTTLQKAYLVDANLKGADLLEANLEGANLGGADLQRADVLGVNLEGADLRWADLQGADLQETNLQGANLDEVIFDEKTNLPDYSNWTPDPDMTRFTDPDHPDFWRSNWPGSPFYRGN
jgi:hypothetical protein